MLWALHQTEEETWEKYKNYFKIIIFLFDYFKICSIYLDIRFYIIFYYCK